MQGHEASWMIITLVNHCLCMHINWSNRWINSNDWCSTSLSLITIISIHTSLDMWLANDDHVYVEDWFRREELKQRLHNPLSPLFKIQTCMYMESAYYDAVFLCMGENDIQIFIYQNNIRKINDKLEKNVNLK